MDEKMLNSLLSSTSAVGKLVSIQHLADLEKNINALYQNQLLAQEFNLQEFAQFNFQIPGDLPNAQSILTIAYPHFPTQFRFNYRGKERTFVIPPTYLNSRQADNDHIKPISLFCRENGFRLERAVIPKKLLAVCSGLGEYGRNNIVYFKGIGSYARLAAYFTDLPCDEDVWREPIAMPRCADCHACRKACPTGSIGEDRFLLHAERCLTWWNEKPTAVEFPPWIQSEWHNCLVGCLLCQRICPENKPYVDQAHEGATFTEAETELILEGIAMEDLPIPLQKKLSDSGLADYYDSRNFRVLLI